MASSGCYGSVGFPPTPIPINAHHDPVADVCAIMSSRKKGKARGSSADETKTRTSSTEAENEVVGENSEGGGGLKGFVKKMEGRSHRMVEMRLAVVVACGVAFRVLFYDKVEEDTAWCVLSLVAGEPR